MRTKIGPFIAYMEQVKQASKNTCDAYRTDLNSFVSYLELQEIYSWSRVTETRVKTYLMSLKKEGKSASTIARKTATLKKFMYYLICQRVIDSDPTERIHPPKVEVSKPVYLTKNQIEHLLRQPNPIDWRGKRDCAMLHVLYATGIKVTELITIRQEDINLRFGCITIHNGQKERVIPLSQTANETLVQYIRELKRLEIKTEYLFCNRSNEQLTRQGVWRIIKEYAKKADINPISIQMIRNSFAAHMIENGADLKSMQELLGVSDVGLAQKFVKLPQEEVFQVYQKTHPDFPQK